MISKVINEIIFQDYCQQNDKKVQTVIFKEIGMSYMVKKYDARENNSLQILILHQCHLVDKYVNVIITNC